MFRQLENQFPLCHLQLFLPDQFFITFIVANEMKRLQNLDMGEEFQKELTILNAIKAGDKSAFKQLFNQQYKELLLAAIGILKDENPAKDAVQDVFFQLWKNREKLEITSSLAGYLKRSVINRSLNQIKSRKPFIEATVLSSNKHKGASPLELLEAEDLNAVVQKTLAQLPERCRVIFTLRRIEGYSLKEIAEKLEISPKTVENQITKALRILKEAVKPILKKNSS